MMSNFICPICHSTLEMKEKSLNCVNGHSFDKAKSGYVNLLMTQQTKKKRHGDDKLMVISRKTFLENGYYNVLLGKILEVVEAHAKNNDVILDAGCGEGWYTDNIYSHLMKKLHNVKLVGIDISKSAADYAAKRNKNIQLAVASVFDIPVADNSCDILISTFAPFSVNECKRALRESGLLIKIIPLEKHLWELKKSVYDNPYENVVDNLEIEGFELLEKHEIKDVIHINNNSDILDLFTMTPYYYKTGRDDQEKLNNIEKLDTEIQFAILIYKNN